MMYSYKSATNGFSRSFWEKCGYSDIQYEDWSGPGDNYGSVKDSNSVTFDQCVAGMKREFLLKVAINNPLIGKFTRCMITDVIEKKGVGYFCVKVRSQTPDVPGGNCLIVHTYIWYVQYDGKSRMIVTCTLEWIKSTWLKSRKL